MRAVIIANGLLSDSRSALNAIRNDDLLIAVDGGTRHCLALGLIPKFVVGDLDSITQQQCDELRTRGTSFISYPRDKDQTDLELALDFAISQGVREIHLLGLLGGRIDQTLGNLLLLARSEWLVAQISLSEGSEFAYLLRNGESKTIHGKPGDTISLISLSPWVTGITTRNLRWPLTNGALQFGSTLGISNEMTHSIAYIEIKEGQLLVTHHTEPRSSKDQGGES